MSNPNTTAATPVDEFIASLDGGQFERMLSAALSQTAAAVHDHEKQGEVTVKFTLSKIKQTSQVSIKHSLKFSKPTSQGKTAEEASHTTPMHVGRFGALSITPHAQMDYIKEAAKAAEGAKA